MYIIAGLGNPDRKYQETRHNVGFRAAKKLQKRFFDGRAKKKFQSKAIRGVIGGEDVLLLRPQTYMNNSGLAVKEAATFFKVPASHILVIYDDIALPVGTLRLRKSGSAGGHNGIKSIISHLGTQDFPRIRIGVGSNKGEGDLVDYVLGTFSKADKQVIEEATDRAADAVLCIMENGMDKAMNLYNQKTQESSNV